MQLIEILLPLQDNRGRPFEGKLYSRLRHELAERFGGVTAFTRAPALGESKEDQGTRQDEIVVLEVMTGELDLAWWRAYRKHLEQLFDQDEILIRATAVTRI